MSAELRRLLLTQHYIFDWIAKVIVNYKKLSKANVTYDLTKNRLDKLEKQWAEARRLRINIDMEATEENRKTMSYFVQDHFLTAEAAYEEASDFLIHELSKFNKASTRVQEDDINALFLEPPSSSQSLPKFSGVISEWEVFRDTFRAMIDSNIWLTNTLKFHYLKSCVSGAAANLLINLAASDDSYSTAWKILTNEYEDKQVLIRIHVQSILCFPPMKTENLAELKRLRDTVATARAALANLGSPVEHWDHILVGSMELKFSPKTEREWNRTLGNSKEFPSYEEIYKFLTIYTRGCSNATRASDAVNVKTRVKSRPSVNSVSVPTCVNCAGSHKLNVCEDFLAEPIAQRIALVKKKQACFNCLRSSHFTSKCPSRSRCVHCRRKHHSLLHLADTTVPTPVDQH